MKILYVSQYFPPEMGAPAARVYELSRHWAEAGHDVTVLTGFPNHPTGVVPLEYRSKMRRLVCREQIDGISVVRVWLLPRPNGGSLERTINYTSFMATSGVAGSLLSRPDVVIGTSPQLLVGLSAWWIAKLKRVPFIFEVRDLWPESLVASGVGTTNSTTYRVLHRISAFLYKSSHRIVPVTPAFKTRLIEDWDVPGHKISVVTNGVDTDLFGPDGDGMDFRASRGWDGKFIVSYVGTIGLAHGLQTVLDAASQLRSTDASMHFVLVGEGAERERLAARTARERLNNVEFAGQQPRHAVPDFIRASDATLVMLRKSQVFETVIPTKMLEFMSCARPVVLGVNGQARQILEEANGGTYVEPENAGALVKTLIDLKNDRATRVAMGLNGRSYIVDRMSRKATAERYLDVLEGVTRTSQNGRRRVPAAIKK